MISFYGFHSGLSLYSVKASIAISIPSSKTYSKMDASAKLISSLQQSWNFSKDSEPIFVAFPLLCLFPTQLFAPNRQFLRKLHTLLIITMIRQQKEPLGVPATEQVRSYDRLEL